VNATILSQMLMIALAGLSGGQAPPPAASQEPSAPAVAAAPAGTTVSGRVVRLHPNAPDALSPTEVLLTRDISRPGPFPPSRFSAPIGPSGAFEFGNVPPDHYTLEVNGSALQEVKLDVGDRPLTDVELPYANHVRVAITLATDDGTAVQWPSRMPGALLMTFAQPGSESDLSGYFGRSDEPSLALPASSYYVFARSPDGYHIASMRVGDRDLLREPLILTPAALPIPLHVTFSRTPQPPLPTRRVSGRISEGRAGQEVNLVQTPVFTSPANRRTIARTVTSADGSFEFRDVPPDRYVLDITPARDVKAGIIVLDKDVEDLDVVLPPGRLFTGQAMALSSDGTSTVPRSPGRAVLTFTRAESPDGAPAHTLEVGNAPFWSALPPGSYLVRVSELAPGTTVRSITAGSANLLEQPFVVRPDRTPESIALVLQVPHDPSIQRIPPTRTP